MKNSMQCKMKSYTHTETRKMHIEIYRSNFNAPTVRERETEQIILRLVLLFSNSMMGGVDEEEDVGGGGGGGGCDCIYNYRNDHIVCRNGIKINAKYLVLHMYTGNGT